ncbi:MAG: hypothetical protein HQL68_13195 [Magnetococcales bacterium]|nr:hypothetical protein [Magnetococcales bacterium]
MKTATKEKHKEKFFITYRDLMELVDYDGELRPFCQFVHRNATRLVDPDPIWKAIYNSKIQVGRGYRFPRDKVLQILGITI